MNARREICNWPCCDRAPRLYCLLYTRRQILNHQTDFLKLSCNRLRILHTWCNSVRYTCWTTLFGSFTHVAKINRKLFDLCFKKCNSNSNRKKFISILTLRLFRQNVNLNIRPRRIEIKFCCNAILEFVFVGIHSALLSFMHRYTDTQW